MSLIFSNGAKGSGLINEGLVSLTRIITLNPFEFSKWRSQPLWTNHKGSIIVSHIYVNWVLQRGKPILSFLLSLMAPRLSSDSRTTHNCMRTCMNFFQNQRTSIVPCRRNTCSSIHRPEALMDVIYQSLQYQKVLDWRAARSTTIYEVSPFRILHRPPRRRRVYPKNQLCFSLVSTGRCGRFRHK